MNDATPQEKSEYRDLRLGFLEFGLVLDDFLGNVCFVLAEVVRLRRRRLTCLLAARKSLSSL